MWMDLLSGVILAAVLLLWDRDRLRKADGRAKLVYGLLFGYALYTGIGYLFDHLSLPNLPDATQALFRRQAAWIDKLLKADTYG